MAFMCLVSESEIYGVLRFNKQTGKSTSASSTGARRSNMKRGVCKVETRSFLNPNKVMSCISCHWHLLSPLDSFRRRKPSISLTPFAAQLFFHFSVNSGAQPHLAAIGGTEEEIASSTNQAGLFFWAR